MAPFFTYTTQDEISYLDDLAHGVSHLNTANTRRVASFYVATKIILLNRRHYDPGVDVEALKSWIRERLDSLPGPDRDRLLADLDREGKA